jgi:uncharacterized protein (DUF1810 family)
LNDPFNLSRFVAAQSRTYADAIGELRRGRKTSHWMWFVFPQIAGLGWSPPARFFAVASLAEARAYLDHPVLGSRLRECVEVMMTHGALSARDILGATDEMKFRSSLTLFAETGSGEPLFAEALTRFFAGEADALTLAKLGSKPGER